MMILLIYEDTCNETDVDWSCSGLTYTHVAGSSDPSVQSDVWSQILCRGIQPPDKHWK